MYRCVVATLACPRSSCTARMSAPPSSRCVANECRRVCGVTRRPGSSVPPYRSTIARMSRLLKGFFLPVEEEVRRRPRRHHGAARAQVFLERARREVGHRDLALLRPLPEDQHAAPSEVDPLDGERGHLADPEPGAVEELEDRAVAQGHGALRGRAGRPPGAVGASARAAASRGAQDRRQPVHHLGAPQQQRGVVAQATVRDGPPVEGVDGAHPPRDRRARVAQRVLLGEEPPQQRVVASHRDEPSRSRNIAELRQIAPVRRHRVGRKVPLQAEVIRERLDQRALGGGQLLAHTILSARPGVRRYRARFDGRGPVCISGRTSVQGCRPNPGSASTSAGERALVASGDEPYETAELQPQQRFDDVGNRHRGRTGHGVRQARPAEGCVHTPFGLGQIRRRLGGESLGHPEIGEEVVGASDQGGPLPQQLERGLRERTRDGTGTAKTSRQQSK